VLFGLRKKEENTMGVVIGQTEYRKFKKEKPLTRKEAILAQCYVCNGMEESGEDCITYSCPLYEYHPHGSVFDKKRAENREKYHAQPPELKEKQLKGLTKGKKK
jgi:hypothetical protein